MRTQKELDNVIRIIDKLDGLLTLIKGINEISIRPNAKALLSTSLPSFVIFNCMGEKGTCSVKIPMILIDKLAEDPTLDRSLANLYEKIVYARIEPTKNNYDYFYVLDKDEFVRLN